MKTLPSNSKFVGMISGRRIYAETRGINYVQHNVRPNEAEFSGTIRELERNLKSSFVRFHRS
jgi:DNA-binding LytR/AlgR family response regulator